MSKTSGKLTNKGDMFKQEDVLQAVVISDSFNTRFAPVSENLPQCLFPLANVPILHYTISQLIDSGIQEIIVFCCSFADKIRTFVESKGYSKVVLKVITGESAQSLGDAMRDIDSRRLIHSDFILVHGDLVTNVNFKQLLEKHKLRRTKDNTSVMTTVWGQGIPFKGEQVIVGYHPQDMKLVFLADPAMSKALHVKMATVTAGLELRRDLVDVGISVCSIVIPPLFQDNFDYDTVDDLVTGVITNEEILNNSVHLEIVGQFVGRAVDMFHYERLTEVILRRRASPRQPTHLEGVLPFGGLPNSSTVYISNSADVDRTTTCRKNTLVGKRSKVGRNCLLDNCIVGNNCRIGENVTLTKCVLWDNVTIENNCSINRSLFCSDVIVKSDSKIEERSVLAHGVIVGPCANLAANTVLVGDGGDTLKSSIIGKEGKAFRYRQSKEEDSDGDFDSDEEEKIDIWCSPSITHKRKSLNEKVGDTSKPKDLEEEEEVEEPKDAETLCLEEVRITLERGLKEKVSSVNTILEVNSLKHAYNIPIEDLYFLVSKAFIEFPLSNSSTSNEYLTSIKHMVKTLPQVLSRYVENDRAIRQCLQAIEETACENDIVMEVVMKLIHLLYEEDILTEEAIVWWYDSSPLLSDEDISAKTKLVRKNLAPFITWLKEAEEESD